MRLQRFVLLCSLLVVLLLGCQLVPEETIVKNDNNAVTIHTVEFYSRAPIETVEIGLTIGGTTVEIGRQSVSSEGTVTFEQLEPGTQYTASIYRRLNGITEVQSTHSFTFDPVQQHVFFETFYSNHRVGLAVPLVMQNPELPNGCEITSLAAILQYYGEDVSHLTLANDYLRKEPVRQVNAQRIGPDPNVAFAGDPASPTGYYVFPQPVVKAGNDYFVEANSHLRAYDITGTTVEELKTFLSKGIPVLTWITIDLQPARKNNVWHISSSGIQHMIYSNLHAVVVMQITDRDVIVMNPLKGYETISLSQFKTAYETLNSRAIVVY